MTAFSEERYGSAIFADEEQPIKMTNVTRLYKVIFSDDAAESMMMALPFATLAPDERKSPLVGYFQIQDWEAVELAQQPGFTVTRAREDWSI